MLIAEIFCSFVVLGSAFLWLWLSVLVEVFDVWKRRRKKVVCASYRQNLRLSRLKARYHPISDPHLDFLDFDHNTALLCSSSLRL